MSLAARALISPEISLVIAIIVIGAVIQAQNPVFLKYDNLILVLKAASATFVMAVAMTFVLISGGIDLSVGSMSALGGVVAAMSLTSGLPIPVAILLSLLVGAGIGTVVGWLVSWARIPALIVTLGALYIVRGIDLVMTGGVQIFPLPADLQLPRPGFRLRHPVPRHLRDRDRDCCPRAPRELQVRVPPPGGRRQRRGGAGSGDQRAAGDALCLRAERHLRGPRRDDDLRSDHVGDPASGQGTEIAVISSVIVGGASLFGAIGSITGTALGVILIAIMQNGLLLMKISSYWQFVVLGAVVIGAVAIDSVRRQRVWRSNAK